MAPGRLPTIQQIDPTAMVYKQYKLDSIGYKTKEERTKNWYRVRGGSGNSWVMKNKYDQSSLP